MRAKLTDRKDGLRFYEIVDGPRWWTAAHWFAQDRWHLQNEKLIEVNEMSKLGCRIVAACETEAKQLDL